ncbi:FAD-dependent oxidoreductase [Ochrobactrum quorumnocens]|uniref:FAD-dependent oxidoreductase n=1 Tax=Ochrobactrum quorumnocens TaxID=271865 RepID=A0A5N1K1B1_9HYPH|nr:FAD-dependent oxidoreductase [[Ochrobactrum] quorumnocens]KAA9367255.1 FAD-dependent oxidoreductase [[Ochrobactrum] quorumnocens]
MRVLMLRKQERLAGPQTGHHSGVIHTGVQYQPGSPKAQLWRAGERATKDFCDEHAVVYRAVGKMVVATSPLELYRL